MRTLDELKLAYLQANAAVNALEHERDSKTRERMWEYEKQLNAEMNAEYGDRLSALREAAAVAEDAYLNAKEADALSGKDAPYPLGTRMVKWEGRKFSRGKNKTDVVGIIEVITRDSEHPDNMTFTSPVGSLVIRLLKKDGSKSKRYERYDNYLWYPEGVDPNTSVA